MINIKLAWSLEITTTISNITFSSVCVREKSEKEWENRTGVQVHAMIVHFL